MTNQQSQEGAGTISAVLEVIEAQIADYNTRTDIDEAECMFKCEALNDVLTAIQELAQ